MSRPCCSTIRRRPSRRAASATGEVAEWSAERAAVQILDVRNPGEQEAGVIAGARRIPLARLLDRLDELDRSVPTVVYCAGGYRSSIAASLLRAHGFASVADVQGCDAAARGARDLSAELEGGSTARWELDGLRTTEPNVEVGVVHPKAMPAILTEAAEWETWPTAPWAEANALQRPLPDGALQIVAPGERKTLRTQTRGLPSSSRTAMPTDGRVLPVSAPPIRTGQGRSAGQLPPGRSPPSRSSLRPSGRYSAT